MQTGDNAAREKSCGIKVPDMSGVGRELKRVIKIAVIHCAVPSDMQLMATHQFIERGLIKCPLQQVLIFFRVTLAL